MFVAIHFVADWRTTNKGLHIFDTSVQELGIELITLVTTQGGPVHVGSSSYIGDWKEDSVFYFQSSLEAKKLPTLTATMCAERGYTSSNYASNILGKHVPLPQP